MFAHQRSLQFKHRRLKEKSENSFIGGQDITVPIYLC